MSFVNNLTTGILPTMYPRNKLTPNQALVNIIKSVAMSVIFGAASLTLLPETFGIIAAGILMTTSLVTIIKSLFMMRVQGGHLRASAQPAMLRNPERPVVVIQTSHNTHQAAPAPTPRAIPLAPPLPAPRAYTRAVDRSAEHLPSSPPAAHTRAVDRSRADSPPPPAPAPASAAVKTQRPIATREAAPAGESFADALAANRKTLRRAPKPTPQPQRAQERTGSEAASVAAEASAARGSLRPAAKREARPAAAAAPANPFAGLRNALRPAARRDDSRAQAR
jgi:hypothetical protein